jgi:hypothetical protein
MAKKLVKSPKAQGNAMANFLRRASVGPNMGSATPNRQVPPSPPGVVKQGPSRPAGPGVALPSTASQPVVSVPVSILGANPAIGDSVTFDVLDITGTEAKLGNPAVVKAAGQPALA